MVAASTATYNAAEAVGGAEKWFWEVLGIGQIVRHNLFGHCYQMSGEEHGGKDDSIGIYRLDALCGC
jgi:hypothetical protein